MGTKLKFGLLLPHFCEHASVERCIEGAKIAEAYGFDSVWVRDHLVFEPHGIEGTDNTHIEGLLVLSAVATVAKKLTLGTAMVICHRHPIHLAQLFAGLSAISNGRLIMGVGLGVFPHEFAAAGRPNTLQERALAPSSLYNSLVVSRYRLSRLGFLSIPLRPSSRLAAG